MKQTVRVALLRVTGLSVVPQLTVARPIAANPVLAAIHRAVVERAIISKLPRWAHAHKVEALKAVAVVRAHSDAAVISAPSRLALAGALDAAAVERAVLGACLDVTGAAGEARRTVARAIEAVATVRAVLGAGIQRAVIPGPSRVADACRVVRGAYAVARAVVGTRLGGAIFTLESGVAVAHPLVTETAV